MYSASNAGKRRPALGRIGTSFVRLRGSSSGATDMLKRHGLLCSVTWSDEVHGKKDIGDFPVRQVPKDDHKSTRSIIAAVKGVKPQENIQNHSNHSADKAVGKFASNLTALLKHDPQPSSAPASSVKKRVVFKVSTLAEFLEKLSLSKYLINFQAEEVDMLALKHMNDDDLKSIGLPMGPRKKVLVALASAKARARSSTLQF